MNKPLICGMVEETSQTVEESILLGKEKGSDTRNRRSMLALRLRRILR